MNIILAIVLFSAFYTHFGFPDTTLSQIQEKSAAHEIGLAAGDKIIGLNGGKVFTTDDINIEIGLSKGETMNIEFERDGNKVEKSITPKYNQETGKYMLGVVFGVVENPTFVAGFKHSLNETATIVTNNYKVIANLVQGKGNLKTDVGGPVAIIQISSSAAKAGIWNLTYLIAVMSAGLGIVNLLPLPVLDGGHCILILIELITRRRVPDKIVGVLNTIGFVLLFGIMILVTVKDILFPMNF
jgi:regulator of sigma E protease